MKPHTTRNTSVVPAQATWRFTGADWNAVGVLEVFLPKRKSTGHADLHIKARIEDCDGEFGFYEVYENNVLVACDNIAHSHALWQDGKGPQNEAERVISRGATGEDRQRAAAFIARLQPPCDGKVP